MEIVRCRCGKIVCQVNHLPTATKTADAPEDTHGPAAVILCRHCKTYVILRIPSITGVQYTHTLAEFQSDSFSAP